jgi:hypothetical protein
MPSEPFDIEIDEKIAALLSSDSGREFRRSKASLAHHDFDEIVQALIRATHKAGDQKHYNRAVKLLAEYGGEEAVAALAVQARMQRRFPRIAMRALSMCNAPSVVPVMLDIMKTGGRKQRRAAVYALVRMRAPSAIEPLCNATVRSNMDIGPEALQALSTLGHPADIARLALSEPTHASADHLRVLNAIGRTPLREGWLRTTPFDPRRFLDQEVRNQKSEVREQALAALELLKIQSTLLRSSESDGEIDLLRAASGPGNSMHASLLRPTDSMTAPPSGRTPWVIVLPRWLFQLLRKLRGRNN